MAAVLQRFMNHPYSVCHEIETCTTGIYDSIVSVHPYSELETSYIARMKAKPERFRAQNVISVLHFQRPDTSVCKMEYN